MPDLEFRGGVAALHRLAFTDWVNLPEGSPPIECVVSGPGGTGKTTGILGLLLRLLVAYPKSRQLWCRMTRADLTDSVLASFEDDVLPEDSYLLDGPQRKDRHGYVLANGSEVVLAGMDRPSKKFSTSFDVVYFNELFEMPDEDAWEKFRRALRNRRMPFHLLIADTNPESETHWVYLRNQGPEVVRL